MQAAAGVLDKVARSRSTSELFSIHNTDSQPGVVPQFRWHCDPSIDCDFEALITEVSSIAGMEQRTILLWSTSSMIKVAVMVTEGGMRAQNKQPNRHRQRLKRIDKQYDDENLIQLL